MVTLKFYKYKGSKIPVEEGHFNYVRDLYTNYKNIHDKHKDKVTKKSWREALDWFFNSNSFSLDSKRAVKKILIDSENDIISLQMESTDEVFPKLEEIFLSTGWYFFLTGILPEISQISKVVDKIKRRYTQKELEKTWSFDESGDLTIKAINPRNIGTSLLVTIGNKKIVLDAGFKLEGRNWFCPINKILPTEPLAVFLSHAHFDHYQGLIDLFERYENPVLLCSRTTLDFFVFLTKKDEYYSKGKNFTIDENDIIYKIIQNTVTVKSGDVLNFNNCSLKFHFSGHMPGALMLTLSYKNKQLLYSGDFHYYDMYPVTGVEKAINEIPRSLDLVIIEGAVSKKHTVPLNEVIEKLFPYLRENAEKRKKVLIIADPSSLAIILFLKIDGYFRTLQIEEGFNLRPAIVLDRDCKEFVKILQYRKEDLHPELIRSIDENMNPFMSALVSYVENEKELIKEWNRKDNQIYILGTSKLEHDELSYKALELIKDDPESLIYITGTVRKDLPLEIISGNDEIEESNIKMKIKARIYNIIEPESELSLHADKEQILKFIEKIQPKKVIMFHAQRKDLVSIRQEIKRRYKIQTLYASEEEIKC